MGETNAVASIVFNPDAASFLMNSILVSVGTICASFCSPSRGLTSTMRTLCGVFIGQFSSLLGIVGLKVQKFHTLGDLVAHRVVEALNPAGCRRVNRIFHLHRFQHQQRRALFDPIAFLVPFARSHGRA